MIYAEFECTRSREDSGFFAFLSISNGDGVLKLKGENKKYAQPSGSAFICAHDILEHSEEDRGTIEHELRALGAAPWIRERMYDGVLNPNWMLLGAVGHDIGSTLDEYCDPYKGLDAVPEFDDNWTPREFSMWVAIEAKAREEAPANAHMGRAMRWAQYGYRRAQERYPNQTVAHVAYLQIKELFEVALHNMQVGWLLRVIVNEKTGEFDSQIIFNKAPEGVTEFEIRDWENSGLTLSRFRHWKLQEEEARHLKTLVLAN